MHRIGSWWLLGLCLLLPALASAAELEQVEGQVLVDAGNGFTAAGPGRLAPGHRVILLEQAWVTIAYGDCRVRIESPTVYTVTATPPCARGEATLSIRGGASAAGSTVDSASLSGFVWRDLNDNGSLDGSENKLGGINIALVNESCQVGVDCLVSTTDSDGNYGFASVVPGTYSVTVMGEDDDDDDRTVVAVITMDSGGAYTLNVGLGSSGFVAAPRSLAVVGAAAVGKAATGGATLEGAAGVGNAAIIGWGLAVGAMAISADSNGKRLSP